MQSRRARKSLEQWTELVDQFDSSGHSMVRIPVIVNTRTG